MALPLPLFQSKTCAQINMHEIHYSQEALLKFGNFYLKLGLSVSMG